MVETLVVQQENLTNKKYGAAKPQATIYIEMTAKPRETNSAGRVLRLIVYFFAAVMVAVFMIYLLFIAFPAIWVAVTHYVHHVVPFLEYNYGK